MLLVGISDRSRRSCDPPWTYSSLSTRSSLPARPWDGSHDAPGVRVDWDYASRAGDTGAHGGDTFYFDWDGNPLSSPACPWALSPDGRHVGRQEGEPLWIAMHSPGSLPRPEDPWPSVVVGDAGTCESLFRVRSAYAYQSWPHWSGSWLSNGAGWSSRAQRLLNSFEEGKGLPEGLSQCHARDFRCERN